MAKVHLYIPELQKMLFDPFIVGEFPLSAFQARRKYRKYVEYVE